MIWCILNIDSALAKLYWSEHKTLTLSHQGSECFSLSHSWTQALASKSSTGAISATMCWSLSTNICGFTALRLQEALQGALFCFLLNKVKIAVWPEFLTSSWRQWWYCRRIHHPWKILQKTASNTLKTARLTGGFLLRSVLNGSSLFEEQSFKMPKP